MKKLFAITLSAALALSLAACGGASSSAPASASAPAQSAPSTENAVLKVGASPAPHAEILEHADELLAAEGITLDIVEFDDYVMPNTALAEGSLDANYFQHQPYLTN